MKTIFMMALFVMIFGNVAQADNLNIKKYFGSNNSINIKQQCEYTINDALKGIIDLKVVGFVEKQRSSDGKQVMGIILFHNPKDPDPKSVSAIALVMVEDDDVKAFFVVSYYDSKKQTTTTYARRIEVVNGKQSVSPCFDKKVEKVKQDKSSTNLGL